MARNWCSGGGPSSSRSRSARGEHAVDVLGGLLRAGDERDVVPHHQRDHAGEQRVVRAAQDDGVDPGGQQRVEVGLGQADELPAAGDPALDEVDEARAGRARHGDLRSGGEGVLVGAAGDGGLRADDADLPVAGGGRGPAHRREDHLHHRDVVALAGVAEGGGAGGVAGDHEHLDAVVHQAVHDGERVPADLGDGQRAVRAVRGVADVADRLVGQLVEHRPGDRQPTDTRVEDADRRVCSAHRLRSSHIARQASCP